MTKRALFATASVFGLGLACLVPAMAAPASPMVAPWVAKSTRVGTAEASRPVTLALHLQLRDQAGLQALIAAQTTRGNALYGKYLTPEEFRARFAPPAADVARVKAALVSAGFTIDYVPASGLFVRALGNVGLVRQTFGVSQELYQYNGRVLRANAEAPTLPASLAGIVTYVGGLDDSKSLLRPAHRTLDDTGVRVSNLSSPGAKADAPPPTQGGTPSPFCSTYWGDHKATLSTPAGKYPATLPWLLCSYTPAQVKQAYGADRVTQDGSGVRVGIVDLYASPTIFKDANRYSAKFGLKPLTYTNFQEIIPKGIYHVPANDPCGPQGWYVEETLDVESVHSMAQGANIVYAGDTCSDPGNTALYNLIDNRLADIITNSYSYGGENVPAAFIQSQNQYFMQAAAEGISVMFSSGDAGDLSAANGIESGTWDATSPFVTAIGGTSLALLDASGKKAEWGWGNYRAFLAGATVAADGKSITDTGFTPPFAYYAGAGGGPSLVELAPDYQSAVPYPLSGYTHLANGTLIPLEAPHRVTPDISMVGDPYTGFLVGETYTTSGNPISDSVCTPINTTLEYCVQGIGGTSLASPLFAGVLALVDQARLAKGMSPVGFVNPALYALPTGVEGSTAPIIDVLPPKRPTALLRGYLGNLNEVRVVTMNSTPNAAGTAVFEGANTHLRTTAGYDNVTGLGTPNVPALISALSQ